MHSAQSLARHLSLLLGAPVQVRTRKNRGTPVRAKALRYQPFAKGGVELELHELFLDAPEQVYQDMSQWLRVGRRAKAASTRLDAWVNRTLADLPPSTPRRVALKHEGLAHDLLAMQTDLVQGELHAEFAKGENRAGQELLVPTITWSRANVRARQRSIRLGSYSTERNLIRVHARLDQAGIPERFVRYIVFHELLHAVFPSYKDTAGRWVHHSPAFKAREMRFPDYRFALEFEKRKLFEAL